MANTLLSFGIPVYNNAAMLDEALSYFYEELELEDFTLYVSDNCSTDATIQVIEKYAQKHKNLHYFIQEKNIGTEGNAFFLQTKCQTKYFILMADYARFYKKQLYTIIDILKNNDYDVLIFNDGGFFKCGKTRTYKNQNEVLADHGWTLTHMNVLICSQEMLKRKLPEYITRHGSELYLIARVFNYIAEKDTCNVYWYAEECMFFSEQKKSSAWYGRLMYVWVEQYVETILSLPVLYRLESKRRCLKSFYEGSFVFQFITFVYHIKRREITAKQIYQYRHHLPYILKFDWRLLLFVSLLPNPLVNMLFQFTRLLRKLKYILAKRI